jgi:hypothetical protein
MTPVTDTPDSASTPADDDLFQLSLTLARSRWKRQNSAYYGGNGQATDSCTNAVVFFLSQGRLFANSSTQSLQFGTNPGVTYANFTPSANPGSITTLFSLDTQNSLSWTNESFYNYQARFCVTYDSNLIAVFGDPSLAPAGCLFVVLTLSRLESCANFGPGPRYCCCS